MRIRGHMQKLRMALNRLASLSRASESQLLLLGRLMSETVAAKKAITSLSEVEFRVFSQWGDDGIIQWLVHNLDLPHETFIEFGVEHYRESCTRFLMMNNNWSGFVMDASLSNIKRIIDSEYFWKFDLTARAAFVDAENINALLAASGFERQVGLLHIDMDGNDYWIWRAIDTISPIIAILEYNSLFGIDRAITIPYQRDFQRTRAHYSNLYFGASLRALYHLSMEKGYAFIGCNSAGNNAYFVRRDKLNDRVRQVPLEKGYVVSKYRESRARDGRLTYLGGSRRLDAIRGMPVFNIDSGKIEEL